MKIVRENVTTYEEEIPQTIQGFRNWEFTSGGTTGPDFKVFARVFKKYLTHELPTGASLIFKSGHYDCCGFVTRGGKYVYFSISDVRYFRGEWERNILVRTAKSDHDWTGGCNNFTTLMNFKKSVDMLLG